MEINFKFLPTLLGAVALAAALGEGANHPAPPARGGAPSVTVPASRIEAAPAPKVGPAVLLASKRSPEIPRRP